MTLRAGTLTIVVCLFAAFPLRAAAVIFTGSDATTTAARDAFRTAIGGGLVAGANGSFGGLRREINWDGVPDILASPNQLPADFFNVNSPRGVVFATPGTGFQVSADSANPTATPVLFLNFNPAYVGLFTAFSPERIFSPTGATITDITFFVPGTNTPATTTAFGAVFTDVDFAGDATIQFLDPNGASLGVFNVPGSNNGLSFLGVQFSAGELVARVRIVSGTAVLGANDVPPAADVVAMDDFLYAEPVALAACTLGCPANITVNATAGQCGAVVNYPAPTITGTCGTVTSTPASGSVFPVGTTTVTVTSAAGPTCSFTVTVNDVQPPAITCPANITTNATSASGAVVTYATPVATDNCSPVPVVCDRASGTTFPIGTTAVTCTATDPSALTASCAFNVNVVGADVALTKTASPFNAGGPATFTLVARNNGPSAATNVTVVDTMPSGVTAASAVSTAGTCTGAGTGVVTCSVGTLANGATATITIVTNNIATGGTVNSATISAAEPDFAPANNTATATLSAFVPTLGQWMLIALFVTLGAIAVIRLK